MSKMSFMEKLLDGAEVEWKALGDEGFVEVANNGRKPVKAIKIDLTSFLLVMCRNMSNRPNIW